MNITHRRIVSLVPSLTETLVAFGMRNQVVGCTKFCISPKDLYKTCRIVGGTKDFDLNVIADLHPTHIICNKEENPKNLVEELQQHWPVFVSFPKTVEDVSLMLLDLSIFLDSHQVGREMSDSILSRLGKLRSINPSSQKKQYLYLIWRDPYMLAGKDTYISQLLELIAWENHYGGEDRYPLLKLEELRGLKNTEILMSTEPYPFKKRHAAEFKEKYPDIQDIWKVDGQLMSWYGVRTLNALEHLIRIKDGSQSIGVKLL